MNYSVCLELLFQLQELRFWQRWLWRVLYSEIWRSAVCWKSTDVSEEHVSYIFMVEEYAKACSSETSVDFERPTQSYISEDNYFLY
jgi:hypothetical protein